MQCLVDLNNSSLSIHALYNYIIIVNCYFFPYSLLINYCLSNDVNCSTSGMTLFMMLGAPGQVVMIVPLG